jgi:predicted transcriptional regulator
MASEASTAPKKRLNRDKRQDILLMRRLGHSYQEIAKFLEITQRAVAYTCQKQQSTPQHVKAGRHPMLSKEDADRVEELATRNEEGRKMTYLQIAETLFPGREVSKEAIRYTLYQRGHRRRPAAVRKRPNSEVNRAQ